ncbi:MAG TPA: LysR family transcriptional regulator [Polyangiaceae bacterium]|jgi:LysR family transcriptional regulator for metE and metH|nr:LysR family transcriptional regulator [Polyangiaceae bacterium]
MKRIGAPVPPKAATEERASRPRLDVRDLELVLSLAEAGSTAGAASALHITQSAVSRALAQAEARIGTKLFARTARGVALTPAGERLTAGASRLLAELSALERDVAAPAPPVTSVRLVCECYTAYRWLPSAVQGMRKRLPGLRIDVVLEETKEPVKALVDGRIDVALLTTAALPRANGKLAEEPLFSDEIVFLVSKTHPLANVGTLRRKDLSEHPLITSNTPASEARWFMTKVFGRSRPSLDFMRLPLTEAIVDAARAGMGIAVLSEWMATGYLGNDDLVVKRLSSGPLRRPWRIAYRVEMRDAARRLTGTLVGAAPRLHAATAS